MYENRAVAFIDILGLSAQLTTPDRAEQFATAIAQLLNALLNPENRPTLILRHIELDSDIDVSFTGWRYRPSQALALISDSIVVSCVPGLGGSVDAQPLLALRDCFRSAFWLQRIFAELGVLTRGGISFGGLLHQDNMVIGPALVSAYQTESQTAVFPRVIIDDQVRKILSDDSLQISSGLQRELEHLLAQDFDGQVFVDYLGLDPIAIEPDWPKRLKGIQGYVIDAAHTKASSRVAQKYWWLVHYVNRAVARLDPSINPIPARLDTLMTRRFPGLQK